MNTDFDLLLGRALLAAAWADGQLDAREREALEDLLLSLDGLSPDTWRALHADLDRPIEAEHRARLISDLSAALHDAGNRHRAAGAIAHMRERLEAGSEESRALDEISASLESTSAGEVESGGLLSRLAGAFSGGLGKHAGLLHKQKESESAWEQSLKSRLATHWPEDEDWPDEDDLHRICTGAAILAHVVRLDDAIARGEKDALEAAMTRQWGLGPAAARLATELVLDETAVGLDLHLLLREFQRSTTEEERKRFLAAVFTVAAGDGSASFDEIEEVRRIGRGLLLSHQHFIAAKLEVPSGKRET